MPDDFSEKFFIADYRGLSVQKRYFFLLFYPFLQNNSRDFSNFLHEFRGQYDPSFEQDGCSEKIVNPKFIWYRVSIKGFFNFFCPCIQNGSKDLPNFLHKCRR